ncbi:MAG: hypothetical protein DHS20C19_25270 [Acidimicrobiales bacterium]|nr:MAG: hypothetical protein DHS20C19_25270 [Acidimicrobiales bacterium]
MTTCIASHNALTSENEQLIDEFIAAWNAHQQLRDSDAAILERLVSRQRLDALRLRVRETLDLPAEPTPASCVAA